MSDATMSHEQTSWTDLGQEMWSYLTGRDAAINDQLIDMNVDIPRDTAPTPTRIAVHEKAASMRRSLLG